MESKEFIKNDIPTLLDWFENKYTPGEKGENGNPRAAELLMKGIKGNIVIRIAYEKDLYRNEP